MARGKELLKIPFQADGMVYELKRPHNDVAVEQLKTLSARTTVRDERLYLLVRDGVDYSQALSGSFEALAQGILVVSYGVVGKDLEVSFVVGDCCGGT